MKERPILMSAPMVRASLREIDPKTQTRRIMKRQPDDEWRPAYYCELNGYDKDGELTPDKVIGWGAVNEDGDIGYTCPYGQPGDRLWVRETWAGCWGPLLPKFGKLVTDAQVKQRDGSISIATEANPLQVFYGADHHDRVLPHLAWKPSIHMPRWACRIDLEITGVRVERLQDISEKDALAEGIRYDASWEGFGTEEGRHFHCTDPRISYASLWEAINGSGSWDANPWVWVVEFKRLEPK